MITHINKLWTLLILFQIKHFLADYLFQSKLTLKKGSPGWDFVKPLGLHAGIHGSLTLILCLVFNASLWWLSLLDFSVHFAIDRIKAGPRYLGRFNNIMTSQYWWIFGLDQMLHHLTHLLIIWMLFSSL